MLRTRVRANVRMMTAMLCRYESHYHHPQPSSITLNWRVFIICTMTRGPASHQVPQSVYWRVFEYQRLQASLVVPRSGHLRGGWSWEDGHVGKSRRFSDLVSKQWITCWRPRDQWHTFGSVPSSLAVRRLYNVQFSEHNSREKGPVNDGQYIVKFLSCYDILAATTTWRAW